VRCVNIDGKRAGDMDLDGGRVLEVHAEEERGASVEAIGVASRWTRRRSERRLVCDGEMTELGFSGSDTLKKNNSSDRNDGAINAHRYI
jgi:hypothetical protein